MESIHFLGLFNGYSTHLVFYECEVWIMYDWCGLYAIQFVQHILEILLVAVYVSITKLHPKYISIITERRN